MQFLSKRFYSVRARFAPSPTGFLHLGGLRTALYNYLLVRRSEKGKFILRIEDTDRTRFVPGAIEDLIRTLTWANITFDEGPHIGGSYGPYTQSERLEIYSHHANILLSDNRAYRCFCDDKRLTTLRTSALKSGSAQIYDGYCFNLPQEEVKMRLERKDQYIIRLRASKNNSTNTITQDLVFGDISLDPVDDFILIKSDGYPTYHFASVVDDHLMKITHILRGQEWIPSLSKHKALYDAFEWIPPKFAHLPLLVTSDGSKLSKRHGSASVQTYIDNGIEPEALLNYVALLGWHPKNTEIETKINSSFSTSEVFNISELIQLFNLEDIKKSKAAVMPDKLLFLNRQHIIRKLETQKGREILIASLRNFINTDKKDEYLFTVLDLMKERVHSVKELAETCGYFFKEPEKENMKIILLQWTETSKILNDLYDIIENSIEFTPQILSNICEKVAKRHTIKLAIVTKCFRAALTGTNVGAGIAKTAYTLGKPQVLKRLKVARELM